MAEIGVERRERKLWPWAAALLAAALGAWLLAGALGGEEEAPEGIVVEVVEPVENP